MNTHRDPCPCGGRPLRVLLVHPRPLLRDALRLLLEDGPELKVCGMAETAAAALAAPGIADALLLAGGKRPAARRAAEGLPIVARAASEAASRDELVEAIHRAVTGRAPGAGCATRPREGASPLPEDGYARLTDRQREVVHLSGLGLTARQIGGRLGLSGRTVELHRASALRKMGFARLPELIRHAARHCRHPSPEFSPPPARRVRR